MNAPLAQKGRYFLHKGAFLFLKKIVPFFYERL